MKRLITNVIFAFFFAIFGSIVSVSTCRAVDYPDTPIISEVSAGNSGGYVRPIVTGFSEKGTEVLVYVDGTYQGSAATVKQSVSSDQFSFVQPSSLSTGKHTLFLVAKNRITRVLSAPSSEYAFTVIYTGETSGSVSKFVPTPKLVKPNLSTPTGKTKPVISGLTKSGTKVHVYIDGTYNGKTAIVTHTSGTANFAYTPYLNLSRGKHTAYAVAEDQYGNKSARSAELAFNIELPMPAPTLVKAVVNNRTSYQKPFIAGVAKNDSLVKVYIDKKYSGELKPADHPSGAMSFAHLPTNQLKTGKHIAYVTATDTRGKESSWSNIITFTVRKPAVAVVVNTATKTATTTVKTETKTVVEPEKKVETKTKTKTEELKVTDPTPDDKKQEEKDEITKILDELKGTSTAADEKQATSSTDQSKSRLNLIIFLVFLAGVIIWIIWVNRELVKERKEQEERDNRENQDTGGNPSA